ncbi:MAG: GTP-binding protein [Christensenellales bacterium]|jgi:putative membrane protein
MERSDFVPVYVLCGFLESGKTSLIVRMLESESFGDERTLVICCEEGEAEYDEKLLREHNAVLVNLREPEEMLDGKLLKLDDVYRPERVLIEYNAIWLLDFLFSQPIPEKWTLAQLVALIDATTFDTYMTNMRQFMTDGPRNADLIIVNRCTPETQKSPIRRQMKGMNPTATIVFENTDGTSDDGVADEDLPYDMKSDIIRIGDEMFGTFYLDSLDHPDRYDGKTVRFKGQATKYKGLPKNHYIFGRNAMTCCVDDIRGIGFVTRYADNKPAEGQWLELTAKCKKAYNPLYEEDGVILTQMKFTETSAPKEELVYFIN